METQERIEIDWLSLSPRQMARVMEISTELGIAPQRAFSLMVEAAAKQKADVKKETILPKPTPTDPTPKKAA